MFSVNKVIGRGIKHECIVHVLVILQQMFFIPYILLYFMGFYNPIIRYLHWNKIAKSGLYVKILSTNTTQVQRKD